MRVAAQCSKCGSRMTIGFTLEHVDGGSTMVENWHPGEPVKSFWGYIKVAKAAQKPITTYRCDRCGFLESYANSSP